MEDLVWVETCRGFALTVDLRDGSFGPHVAIARDWEPLLSDLVEAEVRRGDLVAVVGANVGWYALLCAKLGAHVEAYEPGPMYRLLERNVLGRDWLLITQCAVGAEQGRAAIRVPETDAGGWPLAATDWGCGRRIPGDEIDVRPLDALIVERQSDVVIVDVEGDELAVWDGATLVRKRSRLWITEVSPKLCDARRLLTEMRGEGFVVDIFRPDSAVCELDEKALGLDSLTFVGRRPCES